MIYESSSFANPFLALLALTILITFFDGLNSALNENMKVDPSPYFDSTSMSPFSFYAILLQILKPKPWPPLFLSLVVWS